MNSQQSTFNIEHPMALAWWHWFWSTWSAWLFSLLLPLPAVLFWRSHDGRYVALCLFFAGSTGFVAHGFHALQNEGTNSMDELRLRRIWRSRLLFLSLLLLVQWIVFSAIVLATDSAHDIVAPALALGSLIPALTMAPYLTLATRNRIAAVVFTVFLVGCMKLLGCVVAIVFTGWSDATGNPSLPWTHPNVVVWLFGLNTALLSCSFYLLGRNKFTRDLTLKSGIGSSVRY